MAALMSIARALAMETKARALRDQPGDQGQASREQAHVDGGGNGTGGDDGEGSGTNRCGGVGMESERMGVGCGVYRVRSGEVDFALIEGDRHRRLSVGRLGD
ncbi:unnamed protein product [Urochloa humidicola]